MSDFILSCFLSLSICLSVRRVRYLFLALLHTTTPTTPPSWCLPPATQSRTRTKPPPKSKPASADTKFAETWKTTPSRTKPAPPLLAPSHWVLRTNPPPRSRQEWGGTSWERGKMRRRKLRPKFRPDSEATKRGKNWRVPDPMRTEVCVKTVLQGIKM